MDQENKNQTVQLQVIFIAIRNLIDALISEHSLPCITDVQLWQIEDYLKTLKAHGKYSMVRSFLKGSDQCGYSAPA